MDEAGDIVDLAVIAGGDELFGLERLVEEAVVEDHRGLAALGFSSLQQVAGGGEVVFADVLLAVLRDEGFFAE